MAMFTEGLDDSALEWINKRSDTEESQVRPPLSEKFEKEYSLPRSPLAFSSSSYYSSQVLPPLKTFSGLKPLGTLNLGIDVSDDQSDTYIDESESVGSIHGGIYREESDEDVVDGLDDNMLYLNSTKKVVSTINRGFLKADLRVEVPMTQRRFTDVQWGLRKCGLNSGGGSGFQGRNQPHSAYGTPIGDLSDSADIGTPSAPPFMDIGHDEHEVGAGLNVEGVYKETERDLSGDVTFSDQSEKTVDTRNTAGQREHEESEKEQPVPTLHANSVNNTTYYDASGQNAWQNVLSYEACTRLCLYLWARGCAEAPEFLRDEYLLLRNAFGLHKVCLKSRAERELESGTKIIEESAASNVKRKVGKIRVEVKKLRIITRRKLKNTNSVRSVIYMQAGAEYVRRVSSIVKQRINSLKLIPLSFPTEESLSCLVHMECLAEDNEMGPASASSLCPGSGDYHEFYPENQGDALIVEVQDTMKNVQGFCKIPVSSLVGNHSDKMQWWPICQHENECVGKVLLSVSSTFTTDETVIMKNGSIVETLAYDLLLEAAMREKQFHARNLRVDGSWKWFLAEFALYYGVSDSYTRLRYLSYVMNVATPTKDCLELVHELLVPIIKARSERNLTRQEKGILLDCETQVDRLLAEVFQNYKSLDEKSPMGLADISAPISEIVAPALSPAVKLYTLVHDILAQDAQTVLSNYIQAGAARRCRKHMLETDEFVSGNSEAFVMDSDTISTAYMKMKNLCINLGQEIQADIKIHNQHIFPSSIELSSITSRVYSTELCKRLRSFLAAWPPSSPMPHVNELVIAISDFERNLDLWNICPVQGGVNSQELFNCYIMVWIQDLQLTLLDLCKAEKVPWSGVFTKHSTSLFPEEMFEKLTRALVDYEVVIHRWPEYTLILENAAANIERAVIRALEKQYHDILDPLNDSIPKKIGMHVQKLARRQSTTLYSIPSQLGIFLNTVKRILDVLHCRVEDKLKSWACYLPASRDNKSPPFGEQMNAITVLLRTKYKNYIQATVVKLASNTQANKSTHLRRILEDTKEADGEAEIRERMQFLSTLLSESISDLHQTFTRQIFVATCRAFWDKMGQIVLKFLEGRKENRIWYSGTYHALGILDDTYASQMQRLLGNALQDKDLEPPRSITEARSILSRDTTNRRDSSSYMYF